MRFSLPFFGILFLVSCQKEGSNPANSFDRGPMIENMGSSVILPSYEAALKASSDLREAVVQFITQSNITNLEAVRTAQALAYAEFQKVSPYEFGPAQSVALRGSLNTYPSDTAKVENAIATNVWDLEQLQFGDARGFPALDALLFANSLQETFIQFTSAPNAENRKRFLDDVSKHIHQKLETVYLQWSPGNGDYLATFTNNKGTDVGSGTGMLVNTLNQHFERFLRDGKIGIPVGVRSLGIPLPEKCEGYFQGMSLSLAKENMRAIERMYNGNSLDNFNGIGLDNHLVGIGAADLDNRIKTQIDNVFLGLESLSDPLSENIIGNQTQVESVYSEMQKLVILFKVDMPSRLGVLITYQDNDGD